MAKANAFAPTSCSSEEPDASEERNGPFDGLERVGDGVKSTNLREFKFRVPQSIKARMAAKNWHSDREFHESLVSSGNSTNANDRHLHVHGEEIRTTPLFSADVLAHVAGIQSRISGSNANVLPQYSFLAKVLDTFGGRDQQSTEEIVTPDPKASDVPLNARSQSSATQTVDSRLFINMNAPWSAFICGLQGSGKSHTLSCMLEAALQPSRLGKLPSPLAGMVFHYDKFTGFVASQVCEAAYLCSTGIPVTVLVSHSNYYRMKSAYDHIQGLPAGATKPVLAPLLLEEKHLNIERMMKLMAVDEKEGKISLYMESVCRILRSMAVDNEHTEGLDYEDFKKRLRAEQFNDGQRAMLNTRLGLLESFMVQPGVLENDQNPMPISQYSDTKKGNAQRKEWQNREDARQRAKIAKAGVWSFQPGSLTIVDLSCPFVDESVACAMFNICLAIFLEDREKAGRIVALDEAHKFMTGTDSSSAFTESLLSVVRLQRHLATRVIIATQEPTISTRLLDLCSMTVVHRFTSRAWLAAIQSHLAAVSSEGEASKRGAQEKFDQIAELETGQALIFSPSAMIGVDNGDDKRDARMLKLGL